MTLPACGSLVLFVVKQQDSSLLRVRVHRGGRGQACRRNIRQFHPLPRSRFSYVPRASLDVGKSIGDLTNQYLGAGKEKTLNAKFAKESQRAQRDEKTPRQQSQPGSVG